MSGYTPIPIIYTETVDADPSELARAGLSGIDGLGGWKFIKKIGHAFKKIGKAISKVKISTLLKVVIPIVAGGVLLGLGGLPIAAIAKKFGSKTAALVKQGRVRTQRVIRSNGSEGAVLLTPAEFAKVQAVVGDPKKPITQAALAKLLNRKDVSDLFIPGVVKGGNLEIDVADAKPEIESKGLIPAKAGIGAGVGIAVGLAALAMMMGKRGRR